MTAVCAAAVIGLVVGCVIGNRFGRASAEIDATIERFRP